MTRLFPASVGLKSVSEHWFLARDGNEDCRELFDRHYSRRRYRDGRNPKIFVGPGEKLVLVDVNSEALFVWRKFICRIEPHQDGVNCAVFRNESQILSSDLIREACGIAWKRWPNERLWTLVNAKRIGSSNPGFCFLMAGWRRIGRSKTGKVILATAAWNDTQAGEPEARTHAERGSVATQPQIKLIAGTTSLLPFGYEIGYETPKREREL